jgi:hypothetical protein
VLQARLRVVGCWRCYASVEGSALHDRLPLKAADIENRTHFTPRGKYKSHHLANSGLRLSHPDNNQCSVVGVTTSSPRFSHPAPHDDSFPSRTCEISLISPSEKKTFWRTLSPARADVLSMRLPGLELGALSQSGRLGSGAIGGLGHWHASVVNLPGSISHYGVVGRQRCFGTRTSHQPPFRQIRRERRGSCAAKKGATADA